MANVTVGSWRPSPSSIAEQLPDPEVGLGRVEAVVVVGLPEATRALEADGER